MGLDMYLKTKIYLSKYDKGDRRAKVRSIFPDMFETGNLDFVEVIFEAAYWRKANHIHKWFVDNVQEGVDDCKHYYVERDQLKELIDLCKEAIANKDNEDILPTQGGFFFGSTDRDEYYFSDLKNTIKKLERCLNLPGDCEFEYCSSW